MNPTKRVNRTPFQTAGLAGLGGQIPKCYGFRIRPRPVVGAAAVAAAAPFPVRLRDPARRDLWVVDSSWYAAPANGEIEMGPFTVDPEAVAAGWAWEVTWATEPGAQMVPAPRPDQDSSRLVLDQTSAVATALTGPAISAIAGPQEDLFCLITPIGGALGGSFNVRDASGGLQLAAVALTLVGCVWIGKNGAYAGLSGPNYGYVPRPLPNDAILYVTAQGAGIQSRLQVWAQPRS